MVEAAVCAGILGPGARLGEGGCLEALICCRPLEAFVCPDVLRLCGVVASRGLVPPA